MAGCAVPSAELITSIVPTSEGQVFEDCAVSVGERARVKRKGTSVFTGMETGGGAWGLHEMRQHALPVAFHRFLKLNGS